MLSISSEQFRLICKFAVCEFSSIRWFEQIQSLWCDYATLSAIESLIYRSTQPSKPHNNLFIRDIIRATVNKISLNLLVISVRWWKFNHRQSKWHHRQPFQVQSLYRPSLCHITLRQQKHLASTFNRRPYRRHRIWHNTTSSTKRQTFECPYRFPHINNWLRLPLKHRSIIHIHRSVHYLDFTVM